MYKSLKVYQGTYRGGAAQDLAKSTRIDAILNRLSENEQAALIDNNPMLFDDDFIHLAEEMSDDQLSQFVAIASALQTIPLVESAHQSRAYSGTNEVASLINELFEMDADTRSRVLDKAEKYAEQVVRRPSSQLTYDTQSIGRFHTDGATANDLFNFNKAISGSDDINGLLDQLAQFDEHQQTQLLGLLRRDNALGSRMMDQLEGRAPEAQSPILDFMSELDTTRKFHMKYDATGVTRSVLDFDNNGYEVIVGMMEDTVSLLENYRFDDEQLEQMGNRLKQLERSDQRAYLAISKTGFETLLGDITDTGKQIDLSKHEEALETINDLRNNAQVRDLVFRSRMGEESFENGTRYYEQKSLGQAHRDVEAMVRFLTTDGWLNHRLEDSSAHVAQTNRLTMRLTDMDAEQRDQLVEDLNRLGQDVHPITELSDAALKETYDALFDRTTSIANVDDLSTLADAEAKTQPGLRDAFWQATELAGERVDDVLKILDENGPEIRQRLIETLAEQASETASGQKTRSEVDEDLRKLINFFKEDHRNDDKLSYINQAFAAH
ncbi:hypothetical protein [Marinobacterium litorale]|uniref:hypothetical protein n=1 Tax=Marinobacterium litorale TaxID=404770 RepID=UPI000420FA94|nr:hypothetical protein [Marinobacterium litorale]